MSGFIKKQCFGSRERKDELSGRVTDIKASPERGYKRVIVRERTYAGQSCAIDIPYKEARDIKRKESYSFDVTQKQEKTYGGARARSDSFKTYYCEDSPRDYVPNSETRFRDFSQGSPFKR